MKTIIALAFVGYVAAQAFAGVHTAEAAHNLVDHRAAQIEAMTN